MEDWGLIWLEAWLSCCNKALDNFLLTAEYGEEGDARLFLKQFVNANCLAKSNMLERRSLPPKSATVADLLPARRAVPLFFKHGGVAKSWAILIAFFQPVGGDSLNAHSVKDFLSWFSATSQNVVHIRRRKIVVFGKCNL